MFHRLDPRAKLVGGFTRIHRKLALQDTWPAVEFFGYKVHSAAVPFFPCVEHSLVRVQSRVQRATSAGWMFSIRPS